MSETNVKPLEWGRDLVRGEWHGNTPGTGFIKYQVRGGTWWRNDGGSLRYSTENEDAAKAACEADWQERIRSVLTSDA